jgi:hypothetical protein
MKKVLLVLCSLLIVSNAFAYKILHSGVGKDDYYFVTVQCKDGTIHRQNGIRSKGSIDAIAKYICKDHGGVATRDVKVMSGKNSVSDGPKNNNSMPDPRFIKGN